MDEDFIGKHLDPLELNDLSIHRATEVIAEIAKEVPQLKVIPPGALLMIFQAGCKYTLEVAAQTNQDQKEAPF